jgi:succinylglutamate desuccinylase
MLKLNILKQLPENFFNLKVSDLQKILQGPTIIHLHEEKGNPLFLSTLLHGNEHSGFLALQKILATQLNFKRSLILFIGNTFAAEKNLRHLEGQTDFNRIWNGGDNEFSHLAEEVLSYLGDKKIFCAVDIHNNTGRNPFYSCLNKLETGPLWLAQFFSSKIVYFTEPKEVLTVALSDFCPSITVEAGLSGEENGIEQLSNKIATLLEIETIPDKLPDLSFQVFKTCARIKIAPTASVDFNFSPSSPNDLSFLNEIDAYNFVEISQGTLLGFGDAFHLIWTESFLGKDSSSEYVEIKNREIVATKIFYPAMLSQDVRIIKDDCLGYIMEPLDLTKLNLSVAF